MDWTVFATFLAACMAAAATGVLISPGAWYDNLAKPAWTPRPIVFPVVWTTLYVLMAWAAARIAPLPGAGHALAFWALQITLNTLWTPMFFGQRRIATGLIIILCLWAAVAATMIAFFRHDLWAGLMFLPYLVWVSIATALNFTIWRMNPRAPAA